ncbi:uncharacterized protein B0H64DRAFT_29933 [Chaetomium fimeti]|uniref:Uncharacterized protein n=1 Tax=Chaetomium fimeti TaxID=1854472 RepID=A0AAE0HQV8_9PEZI|nr:hypothetical protein B0H64DRAFT_29933 [Chaetomium fimeti]
MEPPTKRPRFGPAPFEHHNPNDPSDPNYEDPEADELNERPEAVNARRDPAARLERSRAFAAFKLKSAFERIFEKYERDFTGVGDEIDLRTGEIVVDNGHVHSLKDAELGGAEEEEEEGHGVDSGGDGVSEAGSLNEEEKMVRGTRVENRRLSRVGGDALSSMPSQVGAPPFLAGGWAAPSPVGGPPLGFSGMAYPGQMPFGLPMQYGTPISMPTTDPTWSTPELPSPFVRNALASGDVTGSARQKTARLSLSAAREQDAGDEDDVFLDVSARVGAKEQAGGLAIKQKVLLARPPPEKIPAKRRGRPPGTGRKNAEKANGLGKHQQPAKSPAERRKVQRNRLESDATTEPTRASKRTLAPNPAFAAQVENHGAVATPPAPPKTIEPDVSGTPAPNGATNQGTKKDSANPSELVTPSPSPPVAGPETNLDPSVYINLSDGEEKLALKPRDQIFRVEITTTKRFDAHSFRILSPEPSEADPPSHHEPVQDESNLQVTPTDSGPQDTCPPERENKAQTTSAEAFSRNFVDPAYAFSDDDEPALPKGKPQRKQGKPKPTKTTNFEHGVLREISQNVGSGAVTPAGKPTTDEFIQAVGSTAAVRAQSPTRSLSLDNAVDHDGGGLLDSPKESDVPRRPVLITEIPEKAGNEKSSPSEGTYQRRMTRRKSMLEANPDLVIEPNSGKLPTNPELNATPEITKAVPLSTDRKRRLSKTQLQKTPARALHRSVIHGRSSLKPPMRQEIPETSPSAQPAVSPPTADGPAHILEVLDSDPPFSSEEQMHALSDRFTRAPSPTLTDPSSKPQPSPALPKPPQPPPAPQTPIKAPNRRRSKSRPPTSSTTTTAAAAATTKPTTTTKKRKSTGVLSLLPTTTTASDEEEDELSILSPAKPGTTTRATPAGHHVRLGLLAPGLTKSASALRLKSAVLAGSLNTNTPTGRGRRRKSAAAPWTPSSSTAARLLLESELVQTPGGTMRRCGEGGFRCEREFCFSCL